MNKKDIAAMQKANEQIIKVFEANKANENTVQSVRVMFDKIYQGLLEVNISECPDDYRAQFQRVVVSSRELAEAANSVPYNFPELLQYWAEQSNSSNPDIFGGEAQRNLKIKYEKMNFEIGELDAIFYKYKNQ